MATSESLLTKKVIWEQVQIGSKENLVKTQVNL